MSLLIYYTGAPKFEQPQPDASKSLGGYIGSTLIPNEEVGNLFSDVTNYTIWNINKPEYRAIAIYNDTIATLTNLKAWLGFPDDDSDSEDINGSSDTPIAEFRIGYANPTSDDCGDLSTEKLANAYSTPYTVTLYVADGQENALELPDLAAGMYIVVYIKRTIKASAKTPLTAAQQIEIINGTLVLDTLENIALNFSWD